MTANLTITATAITKYVITGGERLDPITVILEDLGPGQGRIIIECYGKTWSAYWGAMARPIAAFILQADNGYLVGKLAPGLDSTIPDDGDALTIKAKGEIIRRRRLGDLTSDTARDLFDRCDTLTTTDSDSMYAIFGDDWWNDLPTMPNPAYDYIDRIVTAVRDGLRQAIA